MIFRLEQKFEPIGTYNKE